jgi:hypothetical protein
MSESLLLQGELESNTLPNILRTFYLDKESGVVALSSDGVTKRMFLQKGDIVFAASTDPDDRLGEYLLRRGNITVEQYLESVKRITPEKKQGAVLCELGYISDEELPDLVKGQVVHIVLSMFRWMRGTYSIDIMDALGGDAVFFNLHTADIILRGTRQINSWQRVFAAVGPPSTMLAKAKNADQVLYSLSLTDEESHVLAVVGQNATVADVCAMSYFSSFDTYRLLWGFLSVGCIEKVSLAGFPRQEEDERIESLVTLYNQMFAHIYETLFQGVGERAEDLMAQALKDVEPQYPELFRNVYIDASGRVDVNQFHQNLFSCMTAQRFMLSMTALNELLYNLIFVVRRELGGAAERQVTQHISAWKQKLPA